MGQIVIPLDWRRHRVRHRLRDIRGNEHGFFPSNDEIPVDLHLYLDDPSRIREIACHYRKALGRPEEHFVVDGGTVVVDEPSGLVIRAIPRLDAAAKPSYEQTMAVLKSFRLLAQVQLARDEAFLDTLFSAQLLDDFWETEKDLIDGLLAAPYR